MDNALLDSSIPSGSCSGCPTATAQSPSRHRSTCASSSRAARRGRVRVRRVREKRGRRMRTPPPRRVGRPPLLELLDALLLGRRSLLPSHRLVGLDERGEPTRACARGARERGSARLTSLESAKRERERPTHRCGTATTSRSSSPCWCSTLETLAGSGSPPPTLEAGPP